MKKRVSKLAYFFFFSSAIVIIILYSLVSIVPYLASGNFWFIAIWGIAFPYLFVIVVIALVFWAFKRSKWAFLPAIALLISWQQISVSFGFCFLNKNKKLGSYKQEGAVRILSWNVARWDEANRDARGGQSYRNLMMDWVQMMDADILCLQEFFECYDPSISVQNIPVIKEMGYPYHYFFPSSQIFGGNFQFGLCIFSRFPILDSAHSLNGAGGHSEGFSYVDCKVNDQVFRIFNTHLESFGLSRDDYDGFGSIKTTGNILGKMKRGYHLRNQQAEILRNSMDVSPYPAILCGDIDDIPNSYAYFKVRGSFKDAFLQAGSGLGRTYQFFLPTLRIDYIFCDQRFNVSQFFIQKLRYSDHYPVLADIRFVKE